MEILLQRIYIFKKNTGLFGVECGYYTTCKSVLIFSRSRIVNNKSIRKPNKNDNFVFHFAFIDEFLSSAQLLQLWISLEVQQSKLQIKILTKYVQYNLRLMHVKTFTKYLFSH